MTKLQEAEQLIGQLTRAERAELVQHAVRDLADAYPGIDTRPDVAGGEPCIVRTRIPVWLLERARRLGTTEHELLAAYPSLRAEDLVNAWAYARSHSKEIGSQIRENEAA